MLFDMTYRAHVAAHIDSVVKKAEIMACKVEREQVRDANIAVTNRIIKLDLCRPRTRSISRVPTLRQSSTQSLILFRRRLTP